MTRDEDRTSPHPNNPRYRVWPLRPWHKGPYVRGFGPCAPSGRKCACGKAGIAECQSCRVSCCGACWWKHSHKEST
jgi:hypothetical protein